jgi:asparagine synthase (glutamine-hydrolysing)
MCGIAGWISRDGHVTLPPLVAMRDEMAHRGPDGAGAWVSADCRVGLAHRRLSIIDLAASAAQPMHAQHGARNVTIVFNGEIYNHAELRREFVQRGMSFVTDHSDTEVLLVGYLALGLDGLLHRLRGMFAFALYDHDRGRVVLVRDRVGVKPLYVTEVAGDTLFASEAKALLRHPLVTAKLDHESFRHYLSFRAVPAPRTLFEGIECLGPGELIDIDLRTNQRHRRTWWDPLERAAAPPPTLSAAADRLGELLSESFNLRLVADVPVGLFLSGGVDSAYLLQLLAKRHSAPETFTVTYPGESEYSEGAEAARLAGAAHARHHEIALDQTSYGDSLIDVAWHQDEPIAAPVCAAVYHLARAARGAGVPVVLAGEGSDEVFIGYRSWLRMRDAERWNGLLPDLPGRLLRRGAASIAASSLPWLSPQIEVLRRAAAGEPLFWGGAMEFGEGAKARLLGPAVRRSGLSTYEAVVRPLRTAFEARGDARDLTAWMTYIDLRFRLPQLMLPRLDKMGMAFSVEGRVPYLDHRVIEFIVGLPPDWRGARDKEGKALFKSVAERELPREFVRRKKRGFRAPVADWKHQAFGRQCLADLQRFAERTGLLEVEAIATLAQVRGDRLYFSLVNFMHWYCLFIEDVLGNGIRERVGATRLRADAREPATV